MVGKGLENIHTEDLVHIPTKNTLPPLYPTFKTLLFSLFFTVILGWGCSGGKGLGIYPYRRFITTHLLICTLLYFRFTFMLYTSKDKTLRWVSYRRFYGFYLLPSTPTPTLSFLYIIISDLLCLFPSNNNNYGYFIHRSCCWSLHLFFKILELLTPVKGWGFIRCGFII